MMKPRAVALGLIALAGCAGLSDRAKSIQQTKNDQVAGCHFISRIDAGAVPHSAASSLEVEAQKRDALEAAASAGATHVVWDERQVQKRKLMTAGAYRCEPR